MSGTSMAAPHVAGAAALLVNCGYSASQIRSVLTSTADDLGTSGRDNLYGYGLLDVDQAANCGGGSIEPSPTPTPPAGASTVTETFESGNWSGGTGWTATSWTRSGSTSYSVVTTSSGPQSGSRHVQLRSTAGIARTLNLSAMSNPTLTFWAKASNWESSDRATVQVSTNGSSWTTLLNFADGFDTNVYQQFQLSLNQWAGQTTLYLRFLGQMSASSDYFYVDSISVAGGSGSSANPTPTNTPGNTPTSTNTPIGTNTPTPTNTPVPTNTPTPTNTPPSGSSSVIETFESGNWTGGTGWSASSWSRSGATAYSAVSSGSSPQSGSRHAYIRYNAAISRTFSTSGTSSALLTYWAKRSSGFSGSDRMYVEVSTNGSSWTTVSTHSSSNTSTGYQQVALQLPSSMMNRSTVYLRFRSAASTSDYIYIDSITITR